MESEIKQRVISWADSGGDFLSGLNLFLSFNRNVFYVRNIQAKGAGRGLRTLISEFSNKTKVPTSELFSRIAQGAQNLQPVEAPAPPVAKVTLPPLPERRPNPSPVEEKTLKLRQEFPFLSLPACPAEFAITVHQMISSFYRYRELHDELYEVEARDAEKCYALAREILDAYITNRECWEELNHYKIHGTIKGIRPEFRNRNKTQHFSSLSTVALIKIINNTIPRRMSYYKQQLNDPKTKNAEDIRAKKADAELELEVIRQILKDRGEL
jgi:hypothetical protein